MPLALILPRGDQGVCAFFCGSLVADHMQKSGRRTVVFYSILKQRQLTPWSFPPHVSIQAVSTVLSLLSRRSPPSTTGQITLQAVAHPYFDLSLAVMLWVLYLTFSVCNGKSLERTESVKGEVVLCSGFVDGGRCSQDYCRRNIEPRCTIVSWYPTSSAYSRNIQSHAHNRTTESVVTHNQPTESVRSTKELTRGSPNTSPEKQTP